MDLDAFLESLMKTEKVRKYPLSMYYSEGTKYLNLCQYEKALEYLDNAVDIDPINVKSLLKRIKCLIALREYRKAIEDASKVLRIYPNCIAAIDLKGQAQYLMGDFEGGYLTYLEGRKVKPFNNNFRLGEQLCKQALDNSLQPSVRIKFNKHDNYALAKIEKDDKAFESQLKYRKSARECFGKDRKFMEDLMTDSNLTSIHGFCEETVNYIKACERFWTMDKPLHTRQKLPKIIKRDVKKPLVADRQLSICKAAKRRAESELQRGRIHDCLSEAEKLLIFIERLPVEKGKDKMKLKCDALHLKSIAYRKEDKISLYTQYLMKELEVANEFDLKIPQTRTYHMLGEYYQKNGNMSRVFLCFDKVISAVDPKKIDELAMEEVSVEEVQQLEEARAWANSIVSNVKLSIRESIISPIVDTIIEYSEDMRLEDSSEEIKNPECNEKNNLKRFTTEINQLNELNHRTDHIVSNETQDSIDNE